ncbi:MAG: alpha/beta hydrolase fold domain-containing protein [Ginsengibacter sp.]
MSFVFPPNKKITIWMIGDSTMCQYDSSRFPLTGWGMPFAKYFDSSVVIENKARGGRSTRTFLSENRWQPIVDNLQEGDYVMMQFGHNDEAKEEKYKDRYTPVPDYKTNLIKFITETRDKKASPVLITPVTRMRFDKDGNMMETHTDYTNACYEIAKQYNVPLIDLDKKSRELLQQYGPANASLLFMQLDSAEVPIYPNGIKDNTHFNDYGARKITELVLAGIKELKLDLADRIVTHEKAKIATPSTAGITGVPDTSYTNYSAYTSTKKSFPNIKLVQEVHFSSVKETRDIVYCTAGNRDLKLDAFIPSNNKKQIPAIIIIHGGGWRSGNRMQHYPLAEKLASLGYACFTPGYRLSTEALYPAAIIDVKASIRWVHANAKKYNIDTLKIAVLGFSAGGQLAALTATTNNNKKFNGNDNCQPTNSDNVHALIDIDGILAFIHPESAEGDDSKRTSAATNWFGYTKTENPALWNEASALSHVDKNAVPTLFINSGVDRMHAGRNDYIKVLDQNHIYSEVHTFEGAPHSFCLFDPWFDPTVKFIDSFLKKVFHT